MTSRGTDGAASSGVNDFPAGSVRRWAERMFPTDGDRTMITGVNDFLLSLKLEQL